MRYAIIKDGKIANIILADPDYAARRGAIPADGFAIGWVWNGSEYAPPEPIPPTIDEIKAALDAAIERHLDQGAQALGYKDVERAATYAASQHAKFGAEGRGLVEWRSAVWDDCYSILANVIGGLRSVPSEEELIAELPKLAPFLAAQGV